MKDLNGRKEAIKILEEKAGKNLFDLARSNFLLNATPEARHTNGQHTCENTLNITYHQGNVRVGLVIFV